jgi:hypothetical protein
MQIDRIDVQARVVEHVIRNMSMETLMRVAETNIDYYFTELNDTDFLSDVKINYPHLLEAPEDEEDDEEEY